jgi:hypothetical protein
MHFDVVAVVPVQIRKKMRGNDKPLKKLVAALLQLALWIPLSQYGPIGT